jgi:hypothetical protein
MIPVSDIDPAKSDSAYSIDSLIAMGLGNWFPREIKADLLVCDILQTPPLGALARKLTTNTHGL